MYLWLGGSERGRCSSTHHRRPAMLRKMNRPESIARADSPAARAPAGRIGVLVVNLGTPDATDAGSVRRYLREFLSDARVIENQGLVWKFVLRNSVVAAITQIGLLFGGLIAGAVVVETIFDWPGIGFYTVQAILTADYKVMLAVTLLVGVIYAAVNILVDLVHGLIDPRLREQL